jgi:rhodanese-related sulfurtransferase
MDKVNTITLEELRGILTSRELTVVDVREPGMYTDKHLPRAINIPVEELERRAFKELPKDHFIVVYGNSTHSSDAIEAAKTLDRLDYDNALFEGGTKIWQDNHMRFEGEAA